MSYCACGNELLGYIKSGGISGVAELRLPSKEVLCSIDLVSCLVNI
jgi:hypothetical protein